MPADSLAKARTPEPLSKGGRNWVTKLKPGNKGELPPYIQHIRNAIMARGVPESRATAIAVDAPKRWLHSRHTDAGTKAASALATGQWEKDRAQSRIGRVARRLTPAVQSSEAVPLSIGDLTAIHEAEAGVFAAIEEALTAPVLEAALSRVRWAEDRPLSPREHVLDELAERAAEALTVAEATRSREPGSGRFAGYLRKVTNAPGAGPCSNCGALKLPDKLCPSCEAPRAATSLAEACVLVVQERTINMDKRRELLSKGQAIKNADGSISYPIETEADLKSAAILARSKHGDFKAGEALIHRVAKKKGWTDPLAESAGESRIAAPFHVEHRGKKLHATATATGWTPNAATRAHLGSLDKTTRSRLEHRMKRAGEAAHADAAEKRGKLAEAEVSPELKGMWGKGKHYTVIERRKGAIHSADTHHLVVDSVTHEEAKKAAGKVKGTPIITHSRLARSHHPELFKGRGKVSEADEWAHLPAHKRPKPAALEAARRISPHKGKSDMIARDRRAFGKALTGAKLSDDEHAAARAHAVRTNQVHSLRKARQRLTEAERAALIEDAADGDPILLKRSGTHASMLARVKALAPGETARMPDGIAVKHHATEDGRAVWSAGTPSSWNPGAMNYGPARRTPEDAVGDAFRDSAGSNDPASLGGASRYRTFTSLKVGGKMHRFVGVRPHDAKPIVRDISGTLQPNSADPKVVDWSDLHPDDTIMQQGDGGGVLGGMLDTRLQERARARRDPVAAIAAKGGPADTFAFHTTGGKFGKGRANIHAGMIRHVLDNPRAHANGGPVAMVATRSPGGGAVHTVKGAGGGVPHDAIHVSIPAMREKLPEHEALRAHPTADHKAATDREARHVAKLAATMGLMRGKSVVIHDDVPEGHGSDAQKTAYTRLRSLGVSHADAMRRAARGGL